MDEFTWCEMHIFCLVHKIDGRSPGETNVRAAIGREEKMPKPTPSLVKVSHNDLETIEHLSLEHKATIGGGNSNYQFSN